MLTLSHAASAFTTALGPPTSHSKWRFVWRLDHRTVRLEITSRGTVADFTDRTAYDIAAWKRHEIVLLDQVFLSEAIGTAERCLVDGL